MHISTNQSLVINSGIKNSILDLLLVVNVPHWVCHDVGLHLCLFKCLTNLELIKVDVAPLSNNAFKVKTSLDLRFLCILRNTIGLNTSSFALLLIGKLPTRRSLKE